MVVRYFSMISWRTETLGKKKPRKVAEAYKGKVIRGNPEFVNVWIMLKANGQEGYV